MTCIESVVMLELKSARLTVSVFLVARRRKPSSVMLRNRKLILRRVSSCRVRGYVVTI